MQETGKIECLSSDRGAEWVNKKMKTFLAGKGIQIKNPFTSFHSPHIERLQLTLQVNCKNNFTLKEEKSNCLSFFSEPHI